MTDDVNEPEWSPINSVETFMQRLDKAKSLVNEMCCALHNDGSIEANRCWKIEAELDALNAAVLQERGKQ